MSVKLLMQLILVLLFVMHLGSCYSGKSNLIKFSRIDISQSLELDTLASISSDSILIVNIVDKGFKGNFRIDLGLLKKINSESVLYLTREFGPFRVSENLIAQIENQYYGEANWGWFNVDHSGNSKPLPFEGDFLDSLKLVFPSPEYFCNSNSTGELFVYNNLGSQVHKFNYGDFLLKNTKVNFETAERYIGKVVNGDLVELEFDTIINLSILKPGLYFISKPGLGQIRSIEKKEISKILNSIKSFKDCPEDIYIRTIE